MGIQFIDLKKQYKSLEDSIDKRIKQVLEHGKYIQGPEVTELESQLAEYVGTSHCITCANGTDALQLSMMAHGIGVNDAVFCPSFTFFASAETIASVGATPVFVDVCPETFNICPESLEAKITQIKGNGELNLKAIVAVDLFGLPANYEALNVIARKYALIVIEDAAQGFGGEILGRKAGSFGDIATTSFFPAKPLGCYGDGGAIFTDDDDIALLLRSLCVHGKGADKYDNVRIGMNSRLDTIQAAVLLEKFAVFPRELELRNELASYYSDNLAKKFVTPKVPNNYKSSWAQYTLQSTERQKYMDNLKVNGIPSVVYYSKCMHQQTVFEDALYSTDLESSEELSGSVFSLPMHPYWETKEINKVIEVLLGE